MPTINESAVELAALAWFGELGYAILHGQDIAPGESGAERESYNDVVLADRVRDAIERLNQRIPAVAREEAFRKVLRPESPALIVNNRRFHQMLRILKSDGNSASLDSPSVSRHHHNCGCQIVCAAYSTIFCRRGWELPKGQFVAIAGSQRGSIVCS